MDNDDHNFYNAHPRPPSSAGYEASSDYILDDDNDDDIDQQHTQYHNFPSTADTQPSHISNLSTTFEQYASNASVNGFTSEPPQLASSPDPHDFYRSYRDLYRGGLGEDLVDSDNVFGEKYDGMTTSRSQRSASANHRPNGYTSSPLSSRYNNRSDRHATSSPLPEKSSSTATETSDLPFQTKVRPSQPSLRALVNKFNQNRDEVPPIPNKPGSRSTSVNASPARIYGSKSFRSRVPSEMAGSGHKTMARTIPIATGRSEPMALQSPRKRIARERSNPTIATVTSPRASRKPVPVSSSTYASQSMTDLSSRKVDIPRRPLFGEVLPVNATTLDPGYGIPDGRRRRGSEGSMHTPNPMFSEDRKASYARVSPSSPTAWYLGVTPSLEGINLDKPIPARPTGGMHQRSRSDFTGSTSRPPLLSSLGKPITIMSPPQEQHSPLMSPLTAKRHSQSKIPISTRRPSVTSDSGNSSPSTRANSFVGQSAVYRKPIVNGVNTFTNPKPGAKLANADHQAALSSSRRSPRHRNLSPIRAQTGTSPRLKAYISEAQPMKSPPLRSSRPRQPVSTATTSASRARAADRVVDNASRNSSRTRDPKQKKPPELGNVDFAARRQRIQQAFTKTVEENKRKGEIEAEKRRSSLVPSAHQVLEVEPQTEQTAPEGPLGDASKTDPIGPTSVQDQLCTTSPWETPKSQRELTINTAPLSERSVLDLSQEDSPTLGVANRFLTSRQFQYDSPTPPSEEDPTSAVTTGTAETFFDNEPQDETPGPSGDHRTLLNQVMDLRKPSPGELDESVDPLLPSVSLEDSTSASDRDDSESIQIMLGATPISETANARDTLQMDEEADTVIESDDKWSTNVTASLDHEPRHEPSLDHGRDGIAQTDLTRELNLPRQGVSGHVSMSTDASGSSQPMWSPDSMSSLLSDRTTLDSDSYNTINRVLDSYHESIRMPSETITDIQQRLFSQSPDIARRGEWDARKMTQIYLQTLGKTNYTQQKVVPEPLNVTGRKSDEVVQLIPPIREEYADAQGPEAEVEEEIDMDVDRREEVDSHDPSIAEGLEVIDAPNPQRASLNHPDDFTNTSPSLLDWMHRPQAESFTEDNTLLSPTKYMGPGGSGFYERPDISETDHPRTPPFRSEDAQTSLPDIPHTGGGLGILDINVESPHDGSFPSELHPAALGESTRSVIHATPKRKSLPSPPGAKTPSPPTVTYIRNRTLGMGSVTESPPQEPGTATIFPSSSEALGATRELINSGVTSAPADKIVRTGSPTPEQKRLATRRHVIKELVETESKYGQDMKVVDDIYKGTSNIIVISAEDVKVLFGNSEQIVAFSTHFLDALKQAAKSVYVLPKSRRWKSQRDSVATSTSGNTDDQSSLNGPTDLTDEETDRKTTIGEVFMHHMAELEKVYAEYLRNHDSANQKLASLQKNDKVKIWLKECQLYASDLTTAWNLDSLLVKPVQRILKYPLLLQSLLAQTPVNHPDFIALDNAAREIVAVSTRINEAKKRAEQFEQATNSGRKRKDFDTKKIKIKFPIKVPENVQDKDYDKVAERFNLCFFQLQLVMRDVEDYNKKFVIEWASKWNEVVSAIEGYIDVGHPTYPEVESRYRKLRMSTREIMNTALPDHVNAVRKSVIEPMVSLLRIYEGPQRLIKKRQKRMADYARYKVIKDRGDKLDKKTNEQGEQFLALNDTLKDELPKLFALTGRLVEACLQNYVHLQQKWQIIWKKKLLQVLDIEETPRLDSILTSFAGEFPFGRDEAHLLGIINGSLISEAGANLLNTISPSMTLNGDDSSSLRRPSTNTNDSRSRGLSGSSDVSPMLPQPDFGGRPDDTLGLGHLSSNGAYMTNGYPLNAGRRNRATSAVSSRSPNTPEIAASYRLPTSSTMPASLHSNRPSTSTGRSTDPPPSHLRLSVDNASRSRLSADSTLNRPPSNSTTSTYYTPSRDPAPARPSSPSYRNSNLFSSAMPMEDSPRALSPAGEDNQAAAAQPVREFNVLFLAASVYEFNIDRARREAGYPYLTYIAGEIFDVIGEKGELWLAKNQDDPTNTVGWIWNKHFAKLAS